MKTRLILEMLRRCFFYKIGVAETDSTSIEQPQLLECVQRTIQNELYRGYVVYPESGEWSELSTRHLFSIRVIIRYPSQFMDSHIKPEGVNRTKAMRFCHFGFL